MRAAPRASFYPTPRAWAEEEEAAPRGQKQRDAGLSGQRRERSKEGDFVIPAAQDAPAAGGTRARPEVAGAGRAFPTAWAGARGGRAGDPERASAPSPGPRPHPQSHPHQALPPWGQLLAQPRSREQRGSGSSPGPTASAEQKAAGERCAKKARQKELDTGPGKWPRGEGRASFPRKRGQTRNALRGRASPAGVPPRVSASAPLPRRSPSHSDPRCPGLAAPGTPSSRVLTESGAARRLPSWWVRRRDPGTRGRAGSGRGGGGEEGEGGFGHQLGTRKGHRTLLTGSLPPARSGHCAPTRRSRRRRRMNKMAAATSQAGNGAERRRDPPGHSSGQPRRPVKGIAK